ncbi:MAG TPA: acetate/propionate family kinase [Chitinophagales bacterium]|nr:acetate/propionate family kinase [Chitinophagales bacterium]MBP6153815.1 acetate/propionate family kinase [Chitinophagales bacterium]HQV77714.1 acetate/propionate family kinase [Chitinophagales bacterium]HQW78187.1 acetate/propionate family kinase [Chitinophagales bacterium]HRB66562.1 acetate/propionate family kinase [Chitinophagales bacterium]
MNILVINCGSSSLKADVIDTINKKTIIELDAERLPLTPIIKLNETDLEYTGNLELNAILEFCLTEIKTKLNGITISGIGHRVVHGGDDYSQPILIDEQVEKAIEELCAIAPLHNPANLMGIKNAKVVYPELPNVAIFDTAFHQTLPNRAKQYAIDKELIKKYNIKRFGFHGTSHKYIAERVGTYLKQDIKHLRIVSCHLGNGASACAVEFGRSIETSMGMTPMEGLVMGTRSGDIDAGIISFLQNKEAWNAQQVEDFLNKKSGLAGLSGLSNDMRDILQKASEGNEDARTAIQVFTHRLTKYIGAYAALMGGIDVLVFTGGIGENSHEIRNRVCQRLDFLGITLDDDKNKSTKLTNENDVSNISDEIARVKILAIKTDEQLAIALEAQKIIQEKNKVNCIPKIPIAISARHVHLTRETVDILFGKDYELTPFKPLSQPGQFAANETVTLVGPRNKIEKVRILGPLRSKDQVEISKTDEFFLGIDAPVRESGNVAGSPGIILDGKAGTTTIKEGVIVAWRHIHMHPNDAAVFGVQDQDVVSVDVEDKERPLTFKNVIIRVSDKFKLEMHIDTDEGNAAEIKTGEEGTLMSTEKAVSLNMKNV